MTAAPLIRKGDLSTEVEVVVKYAEFDDSIHIVDMSTATKQKITFIDPDGFTVGPFDTSNVTTGTDGLVKYITDGITSQWTKAGIWRWFITYTIPAGTYSTEDAVREILE